VTLRERFETVANATEAVVLPILQAYDPSIVQLHFQYGHALDILKELVKLSGTHVGQYQQFPLLAVFEDVPLRGVQGVLSTMSPRIIVCNTTNPEYSRTQRDTLNFKPILWPIVKEFKYQLHKSGLIGTNYKTPGTTIERPFWGKEALYGNDGLIFKEPLDCIEITGWELSIRETNACSQAFSKNF